MGHPRSKWKNNRVEERRAEITVGGEGWIREM